MAGAGMPPSGWEYARRRKLADMVYYAPVDFSFVLNNIFSKLRPRGLVVVETELWPGMISSAKKNGARVLVVNARMSEHSFFLYRLGRIFWRGILGKIDFIAARSDEDAERFVRIGYPEKMTSVTGNIKYDGDFNGFSFTKEEIGFKDTDLVFAAGSTRDGEEKIVIDSWLELKNRYPHLKLLIAPRHLNRVPEIARLLEARKILYSVRSPVSREPFDCLLVNTMGELQRFYSVSDIAFVGGSLVNKGGQNPIEPAAFGKPVIFGPFMQNFKTEANILTQAGGGYTVESGKDLSPRIESFITDENLRSESGKKALSAVQSQKGSLNRTVEIIRRELARVR